MEIGGTNSGEFDQLLITGTANLNGDLNISLLDGYTPTLGDTFDILTFGDQASPATSWSAKGWRCAIALETLPQLTPRI